MVSYEQADTYTMGAGDPKRRKVTVAQAGVTWVTLGEPMGM